MSIAHGISDLAAQMAEESQQRAATLQAKLQEIEAQRTEVQAELDAAKLARQRLANFQVQIGLNFQCPQCWIYNGVQSSLRPIPSGTGEDVFRCDICHAISPSEFTVPAG